MKIFCLTQNSQQRILYDILFNQMEKFAHPCEPDVQAEAGQYILDPRGLAREGCRCQREQ